MGRTEFSQAMAKAVQTLRAWPGRDVLLIFHDDADGVSSAAIAQLALEREGYAVRSFCLEKAYPQVVSQIHHRSGQLIFYVDLGSAHAGLLSQVNQGRNLTLILDHHTPERATDPQVINLCPDLWNLKGAREVSGATTCYEFARQLSRHNRDLAWLTPIGSVEIPGDLVGLNRRVLTDASEQVEVVKDGRERYRILPFNRYARRLATILTTLASMGYYRGGPALAVSTLTEGKFSAEVGRLVAELEAERRKLNRRVLSQIRQTGLSATKNVQWFHAHDVYAGMGTKAIGTFCSYLQFQRGINPARYLIGFMNMSRQIPGWGKLDTRRLVKFSVRAPHILRKLIEEGRMPHAGLLAKRAVGEIGGVVAEGHPYAASGVIYRGQEEQLIHKLQEIIRLKSV